MKYALIFGLALSGTMTLESTALSQAPPSDCTAKIKAGRAPYPGVPEEVEMPFYSQMYSTTGKSDIPKMYYMGNRALDVPVHDLYDISEACDTLPFWEERAPE